MDRFKKWIDLFDTYTTHLSRYLEWVGVIGILIMFFVNFIDVVGAKFFLWPFPGATEVISFSQIVAIAPAIAFTLIVGRHIRVEFIVDKLPKRMRATISMISSLLSFSIFVLLLWQSILYGDSLKKAGEIGSTSHIPFYPFAYLIAFSSIPVCLAFLVETLKSLLEVIKDGSS